MCHNTMLLGLGAVYALDYVIVWKCSVPSTRAKRGDVLVLQIPVPVYFTSAGAQQYSSGILLSAALS